MTRAFISALIVTLLLSACTAATTTPPTPPQAGATIADPVQPPSAGLPPPPGTRPAPDQRQAALTTVENIVEMRASAAGTFATAQPGQIVPVGGEVRTGEDGRARLDLLPDGTIVRLAPNSTFTLAALEGNASAPASKIQLAFGKIWILLNGGSLDVETPSGVASVRGSLLGVSFNPQTRALTATCLEGHCSLSDEDESIDMIGGQAVDSLDGDIADDPRDLTDEELQEWEQEAPEADAFLDGTPEPVESSTEAPTEDSTEEPTTEPTEEPTEEPADDNDNGGSDDSGGGGGGGGGNDNGD